MSQGYPMASVQINGRESCLPRYPLCAPCVLNSKPGSRPSAVYELAHEVRSSVGKEEGLS